MTVNKQIQSTDGKIIIDAVLCDSLTENPSNICGYGHISEGEGQVYDKNSSIRNMIQTNLGEVSIFHKHGRFIEFFINTPCTLI